MQVNLPEYYYFIKPIIPRRLQIFFRRKLALQKMNSGNLSWPINSEASKKPSDWWGWPESKKFALVLTHDVDTAKGHDLCKDLAEMEMSLGFRSSFNFVAGEYRVSESLREFLLENDFEVGIHGLYHNNNMYKSRDTFSKHAIKINETLKKWNCVGFRSPCMYHKLDWLHELNIEYDASTFDTDPFEPQPDGVTTIFPFLVTGESESLGYIELPYTLPQDFTLFILLGERSNRIWNEKLSWIVENAGMALVNTHPDYMNFHNTRFSYNSYPAKQYEEFLTGMTNEYRGQFWHALPKDIAKFWRRSLNAKQDSVKKVNDLTKQDIGVVNGLDTSLSEFLPGS